MKLGALLRPSQTSLYKFNLKNLPSNSESFLTHPQCLHNSHFSPPKPHFDSPEKRRSWFLSPCISSSEGVLGEKKENPAGDGGDDFDFAAHSSPKEEMEEGIVEIIGVRGKGMEEGIVEIIGVRGKGMEDRSTLNQIKEIMMFTGPAAGLWICGPLTSLIDTAVIGQGSSIELAALGPGTVFCDYMSYVFMFLSIATSNKVAISLAKQDKSELQHQISILLFVGLACGILMLIFTKIFGARALAAFSGPKNIHIVPAANTYVQIRGLAWPAVLIGWVAQSASLGMKDSWGPLKSLAVASAVNGIGDVVLCNFLRYGIAGAAWATMASQVVAGYMMIRTLNSQGYNSFSISVPSPNELMQIVKLAAPVLIATLSKVAFYSLLIYFATSMGTHTVAAHQVLLQTYTMSTVWGEPLSQTAQSFMPEFLFGVDRSLLKARMLLKSLLIIGVIMGTLLGTLGTFVPWLFPSTFTSDPMVIQEMHKVLVPYFLALAVTPCTHSLEGTLLAGRELKFMSLSTSGCFVFGATVLWLLSVRGFGLQGCWISLVGFQWARFFLALCRLISPHSILYFEDAKQHKLVKPKAL